jgi:hypothetical protein
MAIQEATARARMALAQAGSCNDKHTIARDERRGSSTMFASFLRRGERASKVTCTTSEVNRCTVEKSPRQPSKSS